MGTYFDTYTAAKTLRGASESSDRAALDAAYNILYLEERYEWAGRLIGIVIDLDLQRKQMTPAMYAAWSAAYERAHGSLDVVEVSDEPIPFIEKRAGVIEMLMTLAETPNVCQGLAAALRRELLDHDREVWDAI